MEDARLEALERALAAHLHARATQGLPGGFAAGVMEEIRARAEARTLLARVLGRFAAASALAAAGIAAAAVTAENLLGQALLAWYFTPAAGLDLARLIP